MEAINKIQENNARRALNILKGFKEVDSITKGQEIELQSAVAVVLCDNKILLGLADADDERDGKWCFPGGGIDDGEDCLSAAVRECYEEMGIIVKPKITMSLIHSTKPMVGFCLLECDLENNQVTMNDEFTDYGWYEIDDLPEDTLAINVEILNLLKGIYLK